MEKKLLLAVVLSIAVILLFQLLFPQAKRPQALVEKPTVLNVSSTEPEESVDLPAAQIKAKEEYTIVETEKYVLAFTNLGGSLKSIKLKDYKEQDTSEPMELVSEKVEGQGVFSLESNVLVKDLDRKEFTLEKHERNKLTYGYHMPGKFKLTKEYNFRNINDYIELRVLINNTGSDVIYKDYDIIGASNIQTAGNIMGRRFFEIDSMIDGRLARAGKVKDGHEFIKGIVSWTGVKERYFSIILKPQQESEGVILRQMGKLNLASGVRSKRVALSPGAVVEDSYVLYAGPNDIARLKALGLGLEKIVYYGKLDGIVKALLVTLKFFHNIVRNWGVAIIILTILINIILFPLTRKSFLSMKRVQEMQPHMEKLKKIHKDNPQKFQKEMSEVYKKYKINPLGGCLPMLLQMPIFFALYQALLRSIDLKDANFLWIKDLSRPDFIKLPFSLPMLGNEIHILPILAIVAMFFQQRISTKSTPATTPEQAQQQKFMLIFFPLLLGFAFYNFPAGFVLYFLTNTALMTVEHSFMRKSS